VYCQVVYLRGCHPGRIRHALAELPETLDETYERTLREINKADWELAHRLFSAGPIPKFHEEWRLEDPIEAVLSTCSTLLSLADHRGTTVIQFSHFSVKEFLTSTRFAEKCDTISHRYHISLTSAHTLATRACLGILFHLDENITRDSLRKFPLARYAAEHWVDHARFEGVSQDAEEGIKQLFDASKPHLAIWVWIFEPYWLWRYGALAVEKPSSPSGTPLHYAALCGLLSVVKFLAIEHPQHIHYRGCDDETTPLHLASRQGHLEVARFLVECGADVTAEDKYGWTALHVVSSEGHIDLARLLIKCGADVTAQSRVGSTPLHVALSESHFDLAQLLIEHDADVTAQRNDGRTVLHVVSYMDHLDLARLLIERGADVTAQDEDGWTALHVASSGGHLDLTRLLIERGADVTAQCKGRSTPLHVALTEGYLDLARLLIEYGADVTAQRKDGSTALHVASSGGHLDLVRLLIEHGADVTAQDKDGSTPLRLALSRDHLNLARLLIECAPSSSSVAPT
jgi:ankyrin repeat protein